MPNFRLAFTAMLMALVIAPAAAQDYVREELRVPMDGTGGKGLETLLIRPAEAGRYPLVIISHGSPRKPKDRPDMTPARFYPQALEFARRGFAVTLVMRRGFGTSGGNFAEDYGSCGDPNYTRSARAGAADLEAAIAVLGQRPDIDASRVIAVGRSAGGFASVALAADPPPGLVAVINFAGGRGSPADDEVCHRDRLIDTFGALGKTSRLPSLWVYAANDHYFAPDLARKFHGAFTASGGKAEFIAAPAFGKDGHQLFSAKGIALWAPYVDKFLADNHLTQRAELLPLPPLPALTAPSQLSARGREAFEEYRRAPAHKAFAVASDGHFGWRTARRSTQDARGEALKLCEAGARSCRVVFIDDVPAP